MTASAQAPASAEMILMVKALSKRFVQHDRNLTRRVGSPATFTTNAGEVVVMRGPSGAGKSTLLKCIYRTYLPSEGTIGYTARCGQTIDLRAAAPDQVLSLRDREIAMAAQDAQFAPRQSALSIVARPLRKLGASSREALERAADLLRALDLKSEQHGDAPGTFSGGERKCVTLARSVIIGPRLLLLDEPTAGLDAQRAGKVAALINQEKRRGASILVVTHDDALCEAVADRVIHRPG